MNSEKEQTPSGAVSYTLSMPRVPSQAFPTLIRVKDRWKLTISYPERIKANDIEWSAEFFSAPTTTEGASPDLPTQPLKPLSSGSSHTDPTSTTGT